MRSYCIERLIGIGGEAAVYEARPLLPGGDRPPVACKLMREARRADPAARALVQQEAALGLRVTPGHPGLVHVLDSFEDAEEGPCIVMELVDGGSLEALLEPGARVPFPCTRRIAREVLQALAYLHGQDVLHRDLSPCNILISTSGSVKIADLGIAKVMAGTPPCGDAEAFADVVTRTLRGDFAPLPVDVPADLAELVTGLLRTERDAREPQTATAALALLRQHDQPVASAAELAALVLARKAQRATSEPDGAHRAPDLAPGDTAARSSAWTVRARAARERHPIPAACGLASLTGSNRCAGASLPHGPSREGSQEGRLCRDDCRGGRPSHAGPRAVRPG